MILLVTNEADLTTDYVVLELRRRGLDFFRLNVERLPEGELTMGFTAEDDWSLSLDGRYIDGANVRTAYFRRPGTPVIDEGIADPGERAYCATEWRALLKSLYHRIGPRWLNAPEVIAAAEDKPRQLLAASELGFAVPEAVVTNAMIRADRFLSGPATIAKPLREALIEGDAERVIFTSRVDRASLRDARSFAAAPMILQREIAKRTDIRVTVIGDRTFATAIHSQDRPETQVDWRRSGETDLVHEAVSLPAELEALCVTLVAKLGLRFGAIDLVEDQEGRFWFLEINPNGQWAWIENRTGAPITSAIVDELQGISA